MKAKKLLPLAEVLAGEWKRLPCPTTELRLDIVLNCGQSFRWRRLSPDVWASVLNQRVWVLSQNETDILYNVFSSSASSSSTKEDVKNEAELRDYFQLDSCQLAELYPKWRNVDPHFDACCDRFRGVRTLRQDPVENLFSFICSSNNNITRISSMVENLCLHFGEDTGVAFKGEKSEVFFSFPSVSRLAAPNVEDKLRKLGFGYRAKFIQSSAQSILENGGEPWLFSLRQKSYQEAKKDLLSLCGVGAKVADCVCLMSLDKNGAVPVDTHVLQIAQKYLKAGIKAESENVVDPECESEIDKPESGKPEVEKPDIVKSEAAKLIDDEPSGRKRKAPVEVKVEPTNLSQLMTSTKTLTPRVYDAIADYFRSIWGAEFAGWAQSVVFAADLKTFSKDEDSCAPTGSKKKKDKAPPRKIKKK